MAGFYFTKIHVFKIRGRRVVDEKPWVASMAPVLEPTVPSAVEVVGDVPFALLSMNVVRILVEVVGGWRLFSFSSRSMEPAPAAGAPPVVDVRDDSPSSSPVVDVGSGSSSSSPVMETGSNLQYFSSGLAVSLSASISSKGEGQTDVQVFEVGPKRVPKRRLPEEGASPDSRGAKKSQAPPQETSGSEHVSSHPIGRNVSTSGFVQTS
ncbi:hypothetical protein Adt_35538 [Abeliophyllum distichum]|uniref:Uncharacterized protein n=1 Tax=Abeliophyllum distichum TaxID=126358 RepID=A0ABD1QGD3_9LAMI